MTSERFDPRIHHRGSIRLPDHDYTQAGAYFITICAWQRECLFGEVAEGEVRLKALGQLRQAVLKRAFEGRLG